MPRRGFTIVTFLLVVGVAAAIFWAVTYGPIYVENFEVKSIVRETSNMCYREPNDEKVKDFFMNRMRSTFMIDVMEHGQLQHVFKFDVDREELRIERTEIPPVVNIWFSYKRTVTLPLVGGERTVEFVDHAEQDLTPVKW